MSLPAVLLVNTGSPAAPTTQAVKEYLREFLSDRRIIEMSPLLWQPLLRGVILPKRSPESARRYQLVWMKEGSPLVVHTERTAQRMQEILAGRFSVHWAMCYGTHRVCDTLPKILASNPEGLVVLPMFAQYAKQTTASVYDLVDGILERCGWTKPTVRFQDYHRDARYIKLLADNIRNLWREKGRPGPEGKLLLSFHGIPKTSSDRGDPYEAQCRRTAAALVKELGLSDHEWTLSFQSKFGPAAWLEPSSIATVQRLAAENIHRVDVICPGFAADCLETLEEIDVELRRFYLEAGGKEFHYIACPNECGEAPAAYGAMVEEAWKRRRTR